MRKIKQGAIPDEVMEFALAEMQKILSGEIIFVAQDGPGRYHLQGSEADHRTGSVKILLIQIANNCINCYTEGKMSPGKRPYCNKNLL